MDRGCGVQKGLKFILKGVGALSIVLAAAWVLGVLRFHPAFGAATPVAQVVAAFLAGGAVVGLFAAKLRPALYGFLGVFACALAWWTQIKPDPNRVWAPELARVVAYQRDGDVLRVDNVRNFDWRSESDFTERWESRSYRLSQLKDVDLYAIYWMGPAIAHLIVSFGFDDGQRLGFSIEVRHGPGDEYGMLTGLFKVDQILYVAAEERDLFALRHWRKDDPYLFRTRMKAERARALLLAYLEDGASLATRPRFYNTLTTNCTTEIFRMLRDLSPGMSWNWRILLPGYFPELAYRAGALNQAYTLAELYERGRLEPYGPPFPEGAAFSAMIRARPPGALAARD
jgi:hypothetical protein